MSKFVKGIYYLFNHPSILTEELFIRYARHKSYTDEEYLRKLYFFRKWKRLDLDNPSSYSEKCQWLKLFDRKAIYHTMVDKYEAKEFIAKCVGLQYVIPTYGIWDRVEDIDWDSLPEKFVIKPTHSGGADCIIICKDKTNFNIKEAESRLRRTMRPNTIWSNLREWPYKDIRPRIIAEKLLEDPHSPSINDYKFMCFNGKVLCFYITTGRGEGLHVRDNYFNCDGNYIEGLEHVGYKSDPSRLPDVSQSLSEMVKIAEKLSAGMPHLRVDLYEVNGHVYCGELTFAEESGFASFKPDKWNYIFGNMIKLPIKDN